MRGFGFGGARQVRRRRGAALPALAPLSLAASGIVENSVAGTAIGDVLGRTAGSTLALADSAGGRFALSGATLVAGAAATDFETAAAHLVTIRETLAGYGNSPRDSVVTVSVVNVFEAPNLTALGLSATTLTVGTAASGSITGATAGSTIAASGLPSGLTVNGAARTWSWSGSGSAGSSTVTLTEALVDSANSPRASSVGVTVTAATLPNWRAALAAARAGTAGPLIINIPGDSTVAGSGAGTGTPATLIANNARSGSIGQQLGDQFAAAGLAINGADVCGFNFPVGTQTAADYAAWNTSVTPGGWSYNAGLYSLGGNMWNIQASGANWSWTAEGRPFDRLVVYYLEFGAGGTFRIKIDGATATSTTGVSLINCANATASIKKLVYTPTVGTHSVEMEWASGSIYVIDLDSTDTTNKASVHIRNLGQGSAKSADLIDNGANWRQRFMLAALEPAHLHIVEGGLINDWIAGVAPATSASNISTLITAITGGGGDVLLLGPTRQSISIAAAATQQATVDAVAALANGTTRLFYDLKTGVGDYAAMSAAGRMFDATHPNRAGYAAEAAAVYAAIG